MFFFSKNKKQNLCGCMHVHACHACANLVRFEGQLFYFYFYLFLLDRKQRQQALILFFFPWIFFPPYLFNEPQKKEKKGKKRKQKNRSDPIARNSTGVIFF
jgi:hypothetical protein